MGPLTPLLFIVPFLIGAAWLFRDMVLIHDIPVFSSLFLLAVFIIIGSYVRHYGRFAKKDPDRLQSEEFRIQIEQLHLQRVVAKEGVYDPRGEDTSIDNPILDSRTRDDRDDQAEKSQT